VGENPFVPDSGQMISIHAPPRLQGVFLVWMN
jgi:hypothetical protein